MVTLKWLHDRKKISGSMVVKEAKTLAATVIASAILVLLAIVYLGVSLWIIKAASNWFFGPGLEANWAVLAAALMSVGAILAGAIDRS